MFRNPEAFPNQIDAPLDTPRLPKGFKQEREPWSEKTKLGDLDIEIMYGGAEKRSVMGKNFDEKRTEDLFDIREIKITNPQGEILELSSFLPPEWRFMIMGPYGLYIDNLGAHCIDKTIIFPRRVIEETGAKVSEIPRRLYLSQYNDNTEKPVFATPVKGKVVEFATTPFFEKPFMPLGLLHEIGHSHQSPPSAREITLRQRYKNHKKLSGQQVKDYETMTIERERGAWAHALKQYRALKEQGFDLCPQAKDNKEIIDFIDDCLDTHLRKVEVKNLSSIKQKILDSIRDLLDRKESSTKTQE
jgi:hypothetical protein